MGIFESAKEKGVLLAAHRGVCGGNIPCNSVFAFKAALNQGADIIELDVEASRDGVLFIQHPGMEPVHLGLEAEYLRGHDAKDILGRKLLNADHSETQYEIPLFEDVLNLLRGKCYINIDKFWSNPEKIAALVRRLGMEDQVIVKGAANAQFLHDVEMYAADLPCMPIIREKDKFHETLMKSSVRYIGTEVLFEHDSEPVASEAYLERMHADGKVVWSNSIVYSYKAVLAGGHTDDISVAEDPAAGWGWLADRGFDIIQTDFVLAARDWLRGAGKIR